MYDRNDEAKIAVAIEPEGLGYWRVTISDMVQDSFQMFRINTGTGRVELVEGPYHHWMQGGITHMWLNTRRPGVGNYRVVQMQERDLALPGTAHRMWAPATPARDPPERADM